MTSQQLGELLLAQWQLLWPLPASERIARIDEIRAEYVFGAQMDGVFEEMARKEPEIR